MTEDPRLSRHDGEEREDPVPAAEEGRGRATGPVADEADGGVVGRRQVRHREGLPSFAGTIRHHETFSTAIRPPYSSTKGWII